MEEASEEVVLDVPRGATLTKKEIQEAITEAIAGLQTSNGETSEKLLDLLGFTEEIYITLQKSNTAGIRNYQLFDTMTRSLALIGVNTVGLRNLLGEEPQAAATAANPNPAPARPGLKKILLDTFNLLYNAYAQTQDIKDMVGGTNFVTQIQKLMNIAERTLPKLDEIATSLKELEKEKQQNPEGGEGVIPLVQNPPQTQSVTETPEGNNEMGPLLAAMKAQTDALNSQNDRYPADQENVLKATRQTPWLIIYAVSVLTLSAFLVFLLSPTSTPNVTVHRVSADIITNSNPTGTSTAVQDILKRTYKL